MGVPLRHESHQKRYVSSGICQKECRSHGSHRRAPHIHSRKHRFFPSDVRFLVHHLVDRGGDIHREIDHRPGSPDEDRAHKNPGQTEILIPRVQKALRIGHHRAWILKASVKIHPRIHVTSTPRRTRLRRRPASSCQIRIQRI